MRTGAARRPGGGRRLLVGVLALVVASAAVAPAAGRAVGRVQDAPRTARIAHSDDGVNLRAEPSFGAEVLGTLDEGETVNLRIDEVDTTYDADGTTRWWPVATRTGEGWIAGFFLDVAAEPIDPTNPQNASGSIEPPAGEPAPAPATSGSGSGTGAAAAGGPAGAGGDLWGWGARVAEPDGVNLRAEPGLGGEAVQALGFDAVVELRIDEADTIYLDGSRWWPVRFDGLDGWIAGPYLAPFDAEAAAVPVEDAVEDAVEAPAEAAAEPGGKVATAYEQFTIGSYVAAITDDGTGLNIRADGAPDAERIGSIPETDVVQVMDGPYPDPLGTDWYLITDGSVTGFVDGSFLDPAGQPGVDGAGDPSLAWPDPPAAPVAGLATGDFDYPLESYTFTQAFGCSPYWFEPWWPSVGCNFHNAVDLAAPSYTPIKAADGGIVEASGWCDCGLGYYVKIDHGNGYKTLYGHMAEMPYVSPGQAVGKGEVIGPIGSSGNSTGPHTHFIINYDGVDQDPLAYL